MKLFLAMSQQNPMEVQFKNDLTHNLQSKVKDCTVESFKVSEDPTAMCKDAFDKVQACDVVVAVLDGRTVDEDVAIIVGLATAIQKPVIAYKTDRRWYSGEWPTSAFLLALTAFKVNSIEEVEQAIRMVTETKEVSEMPKDKKNPWGRPNISEFKKEQEKTVDADVVDDNRKGK